MTEEELLQVIEEAAKDKRKALDLSFRGLTYLPPEIGKLTNLNTLYLSGNQLASIPAEISELTNLMKLDLRYNQLISLPVEISNVSNLISLDLRHNQLKNLYPEIDKLTNLTLLNLWSNKLTTLPAEIGQLINLTSLDLRYNKLKSLPPEISRLTNLSKFYLSYNPLTNIPHQIKDKGTKAIVNFYKQQLEQNIDHLYEAKLLIVGEAGAGKTTLAQKIKDNNYQLKTNEESTEGIDVIQYYFSLYNGKEFRVNIWDFGGQEIYHETHQFFLTERSLYTLVADTRKEDTDFYYWLNVVELLSDNSPVVVIKNEKQERKRDINERQLRGEFTNFKETLATNLATNRGLPEILNKIQHYISNLPHVGTALPAYWVKVREVLEKDTRNYISLDEYLKICKKQGFKELEDILVLSGYFHDLGVFLHFQNDDLLKKTIILNTAWGTDAVYKVLDNQTVRENLGKFDRNNLKNIWNEEKYITMQGELLRLMMNFKLCYEIPSQPGNYIAPQLLSPQQPEYDWDEENNLLLRYEYEFMPKGILTRFIVETHPMIENETCVWKTGVVLTRDNARAEIIELYRYHKGEIRIRVSGSRKRDLLTTVRYELGKIHGSYERLKYKTLVPCNCSECKGSQSPYFYSWDKLNDFLYKNRPTIQCYDSGDDVRVQGLIDDHKIPPHRSTNQQQENTMSDIGKYNIKADIVQITETNLSEVIGKKYTS
ncbi:MAG: COR domain-containing protein, partial [Crocosphaera sp.]